jgi:DNA-binding transcriptional ArsR family regulator
VRARPRSLTHGALGSAEPVALDTLANATMFSCMSRTASDDSVFHAIASSTRRRLMDALALGESNVSDLVASLDVTQSAVSQQLAILKSAGLVGERADGRFRYYWLRAEPLAEVDAWLGRYRAYMERQLDALTAVLDDMPDEPVAPAHRRRRS